MAREDPQLNAITFSRFGNKFTQHSGIAQLMDDMNEGLRTPGTIMLGGGNPVAIPAMAQYFLALWRETLDDGSMSEALCNYDGPQGKDTLLTSLAVLLRKEFDWPSLRKTCSLRQNRPSPCSLKASLNIMWISSI